jgi:NAD(P)-dependent dehydrogenase (short-subunit alcohol dehydrogenase family)
MSRLNDKVVLVTGIGRGIAQARAVEGVVVVASSRTAAHAEATARAICDAGSSATAVMADVRRKADAERAVQAALSAGDSLDCVVHNAAVNVCSSLLDLPEEAWDRVFGVNVKGCLSGGAGSTAPHGVTPAGPNCQYRLFSVRR